MMKRYSIKVILASLAAAAICSTVPTANAAEPLRVLILTGANNHDWQQTTPVLKKLFDDCKRFKVVDVVADPSKCDAKTFAGCDVVVSNWSAYPKMTGHQWGEAAEKAFVEFIRNGGGFVTFHAGAATSQDWPEFQQLVAITWKLDHTAHNAYHTFKVTVDDKDHPITRGMSDFWTTDELWHNMVPMAGPNPKVLVKAFSEKSFAGTGKFEPVLLPTQLGKGRGLNLVLGHDAHAMQNVGWQTLMLRGAEWAATGEATVPIPDNWPSTAAAANVVGGDADAAVKAVADYRFGKARQALFVVEQLVSYSTSITGQAGVAARKQLAAKIAAAITPQAAPEVKSFLLQQLGMLGMPEHVPLLASLLADEKLSYMARYALERISGPTPAAALRDALGKTTGKIKVGTINSLGNLGDAQAVGPLVDLVEDKDSEIAAATIAASGKIGGDRAAKAIAERLSKTTGGSRTAIADAYLMCADKALAAGNKEAALAIYRKIYTPRESVPVRMAALRGLVMCDPARANQALIEAIAGGEPRMQTTAVQLVRESLKRQGQASTSIAEWVAQAMNSTQKPEEKKALLAQLGREPAPDAMKLAMAQLKDPSLVEEAAQAAVMVGTALVESNRDEVKSVMREVLGVSKSSATIEQANNILRRAAKSVNLARGATASSPDDLNTDGGSGPDAAAIDGNPETYWDEQDGQKLYRFKLTFPQPTRVSAINLKGHAYQSHSPKDFDILCDDKVVKTVPNAEYDRQTNEVFITFSATTCGSLELKITGYYGGSPGIRELEVYDIDTADLPAAGKAAVSGPPKFTWRQTEDTLALLNHDVVVWQFNWGKKLPKPYFHPVCLADGSVLTANSPPDHAWHHALWFSWMAIDGLDYWGIRPEAIEKGGRTEAIAAKAVANRDFSATIELTLSYHPQDKPAVLTEKRILRISPPDARGGYHVDWASDFTAGSADVLLKGGTAGGGYAGLSVRIAQHSRDWVLSNSEGKVDHPSPELLAKTIHGQKARWVDFSLVSLVTSQPAGITLLDHPGNLRYPSQWHCVLEEKTPFGYFSPAPLFSQAYTLPAGKTLPLRYRILVHAGPGQTDKLEEQWKAWTAPPK